jgi:hypothetical protein
MLVTRFDWEIFHTNACSLPPEPTTNTFISISLVNLNRAIFAAIRTHRLYHEAFKNSRYTGGYACKFLKTSWHQHLNTPHPQKSLNSGLIFFPRKQNTKTNMLSFEIIKTLLYDITT